MFIGHYGVSFALRRRQPSLRLDLLFILVQFLDILFFTFVLLGVEKLRIVPGFTEYNPYDLYFMPYSHGFASALGWSVLGGLFYLILFKKRAAPWAKCAALSVAFAIFSHWLLDLPMHTHDMPIIGDSSPKVGLGLWNHKWLYFLNVKGIGRNARKVAFFIFVTRFCPVV